MDQLSLIEKSADIKTASHIVRSYPPQSSGEAHEVRVTLPLVNFLRDAGFYEEPGAVVIALEQHPRLGSKHGR